MTELKKCWKENYASAENQLAKMKQVNGLVSAFNANIDAVIKVSGQKIAELVGKLDLDIQELLSEKERSINNTSDVFRGLIHCFKGGIAEEWLIHHVDTFNWLKENLGYDKLQMGGQGGIVANVMAVCGVNPVYVHGASLAKEQTGLFLDLPNLQSVNHEGELAQANKISRDKDIPLIHWIIEFDKGDTLQLGDTQITCPKSNRFIATYDPLNFQLHVDDAFHTAMCKSSTKNEYIILSGYQMLEEKFSNGGSGIDRINVSKKMVEQWRVHNPESILHFEIASTQDKVIRKYLVDHLATSSDSIGFNERELIDILEVLGESELAKACDKNTNSSNLFKGMIKIFEYTNCPRLQLHMFGLYVTLQRKDFKVSPEQNRNGMQLAAVIAAAKAGTGAINSHDVLLWAKDHMVSDIGLNELKNLETTVSELYGENTLTTTGIYSNNEIEIIAVPTIIIEKPVTLVGMGDTISSISLVGAQ